MKFEFLISETENLFFFISNLANWHFSCRSDYNAVWLKTSGPLNDKERMTLKEFGDLMRKHGFVYKNNKSLYLGRAFFVPIESRKWGAVKSMLSEDEVALVKNAFELFKPRFRGMWHSKQLRQWKTILSKKLMDTKTKNIFSGIEDFLGAKRIPTIIVHLIASPSVKMAVSGGANLGRGHLTMELPVFKIHDWNIGNAIAIIAHEVAHTLVDGENIQKLLAKFASKRGPIIPSTVLGGRSRKELSRELIADLCAPYGYFCSGSLGFYKPTTDILFRRLGGAKNSYENFASDIIWAMYPVIADYVAKGKKMDITFLEKMRNVIKSLTY
jgi:hypothetical protein